MEVFFVGIATLQLLEYGRTGQHTLWVTRAASSVSFRWTIAVLLNSASRAVFVDIVHSQDLAEENLPSSAFGLVLGWEQMQLNLNPACLIRIYRYGSIPIDTIFRGMNIHQSQLF